MALKAYPESVQVQVVLEVTQYPVCPVVKTAAGNRKVFDAVAALPRVVVKLPLAGNRDRVPAVPDLPNVGV